MKYHRILLKLSGESLAGGAGQGIDTGRLTGFARQIAEVAGMGARVGVVVGGGNIFRGLRGAGEGFDRVKGDEMGMLATVINGLALCSALESLGQGCRLLTAVGMEPIGERFSKERAMGYLAEGLVVVFAGGTGNPYFTTDTAAALRAVEMEAEVMLKGTRVDGVYTADPEKDPAAVRFERVSYEEVYRRGLRVMDLTATTLCRENGLPTVVFDVEREGNLRRVVEGEAVGTEVFV